MLTQNELKEINGGISWGLIGALGTIVVFLTGLIDGYLRPLKCN